MSFLEDTVQEPVKPNFKRTFKSVKRINKLPKWVSPAYLEKRFDLSDFSKSFPTKRREKGRPSIVSKVNSNYLTPEGILTIDLSLMKKITWRKVNKLPKGYNFTWKDVKKINDIPNCLSLPLFRERRGLPENFHVQLGRVAYVHNSFIDEEGVLKKEMMNPPEHKPFPTPEGVSTTWEKFRSVNCLSTMTVKKFKEDYLAPEDLFTNVYGRVYLSDKYTEEDGTLMPQFKHFLSGPEGYTHDWNTFIAQNKMAHIDTKRFISRKKLNESFIKIWRGRKFVSDEYVNGMGKLLEEYTHLVSHRKQKNNVPEGYVSLKDVKLANELHQNEFSKRILKGFNLPVRAIFSNGRKAYFSKEFLDEENKIIPFSNPDIEIVNKLVKPNNLEIDPNFEKSLSLIKTFFAENNSKNEGDFYSSVATALKEGMQPFLDLEEGKPVAFTIDSSGKKGYLFGSKKKEIKKNKEEMSVETKYDSDFRIDLVGRAKVTMYKFKLFLDGGVKLTKTQAYEFIGERVDLIGFELEEMKDFLIDSEEGKALTTYPHGKGKYNSRTLNRIIHAEKNGLLEKIINSMYE